MHDGERPDRCVVPIHIVMVMMVVVMMIMVVVVVVVVVMIAMLMMFVMRGFVTQPTADVRALAGKIIKTVVQKNGGAPGLLLIAILNRSTGI